MSSRFFTNGPRHLLRSAFTAFVFVFLLAVSCLKSSDAEDDFSWIRGANYVPSYAATDVQMWLEYDHDLIDRELGYAEKIGLNAVRFFLQSFVYEHDPELFMERLEDFIATADRRGLKVMPVLFDSCFGVSPSLESRLIWVANPGPDRMAEEFRPELDGYIEAVVTRYVGDDRIALWDVMNEPSATPLVGSQEGREQLLAFVTHYCGLVRRLDETHPLTIGVATADNRIVVDLVDVLSCHSYLAEAEFRKSLALTRDQAAAAGKPWIVSECGNPAHGSPYEMAMPIVREFGVGSFFWELMIGRLQFSHQQGIFYPDGTVRRIEHAEAVMGREAEFLVEKPDREGKPFSREWPERMREHLEFVTRNQVTEATWRERNTLVEALAAFKTVYGDRKQTVMSRLEVARTDYRAGRKDEAFKVVGELLMQARRGL